MALWPHAKYWHHTAVCTSKHDILVANMAFFLFSVQPGSIQLRDPGHSSSRIAVLLITNTLEKDRMFERTKTTKHGIF